MLFVRNEFEEVKIHIGATKGTSVCARTGKRFPGSINPKKSSFVVKVCVARNPHGKVILNRFGNLKKNIGDIK